MYAKELQEFKKRHNIRSADEWANVSGVSKSTIVRGLKGDGKDMGVNTLLMLIEPYNETLDQLLGKGSYSPEEETKNELVEKIESVIDEIENLDVIPEVPAEDLKNTLTQAQEFISSSSKVNECAACGVLREMIAMQNQELEAKNTWIKNSFKICLILLLILFAMIVIDGILIFSLINILMK